MVLTPSGVAVVGVGGSDPAKRSSEGEMGIVLRRMNKLRGASRLGLESEKPRRGMASDSLLLLEGGSDAMDDVGECVLDESIPNDDLDDDAVCETTECSRLRLLLFCLVFPTGRSVMGRSEDSSRYGVVPSTLANLSVDRIRR